MKPTAIVAERVSRRVALSFIALGVLTLATVVVLFRISSFDFLFRPEAQNIEDLQIVPTGHVHFAGVVTYVDSYGKRFWVQDDTAAVPIAADPNVLNLKTGQAVLIDANKTRPYNPLVGLDSVGLTNIHITPLRKHALPAPVMATLTTLPEKEKDGMRVQITAVVHTISTDKSGLMLLAIGDAQREISAILPREVGKFSTVNAMVQITGVAETVYDSSGLPATQQIWVDNTRDAVLIHEAPPVTPLQSLRTLYGDASTRSGHQIRLRGRVAAQENSNSILLEEAWGAISCRMDLPQHFDRGTAVEVNGFPETDGPRADLFHVTVRRLSEREALPAEEAKPALTSVAAVRELKPAEADRALPVRLTGVVTFVDDDWKQVFLQDSTGGIYVKYSGSTVPLFLGERLTLVGLTNSGDYAPLIVAPRFIAGEPGHLPQPIQITPQDASSGVLDSRYVEIEGVLHPVKTAQNPKHLNFDLYSSFGPIHVATSPGFGGVDSLRKLEDASIRVRGVCGTIFNSRRQLVGFQLSMSSPNDIKVLEAPNLLPFQKPQIAINELLQFSPHARFNHRVKIAGSVTMVGTDFFYIQDATGGLEVQGGTEGLQNADFVEVVGYAAPGGYSPVLTDTAVRVLKHDMPSEVQQVTAEALANGTFDSHLVSIDARLLSVANSPSLKTLVVQSGGRTFNAQLYLRDSGVSLPALDPGSILRLTGISSTQVNPNALYLLLNQETVGFRLLIRSPEDIQVIKAASWWNVPHTTIVLGILLGLVIACFAWVDILRRRVLHQTNQLQRAMEKARAVHDLTRAMQDVTLRKDFTSRVEVTSSDEIAQLGAEFNKMIAELHVCDQAKTEAELKLQQQALTDELTGLPNRRLLADRLEQTLATAKREGQFVALLYVDLDGFKLVNDSLGHSIGDILLGQVAERLRSRIRRSDTLARLGGDEFTVVLTKLHCREESELVAKSLLEVLATTFLIEGHEISISASIGVSIFPDNSDDASLLLQQADSAMYAAKRNGKNRMMYFTPELGVLVRERLSLENQLRGAIARGEVGVHYQPEFDVVTQRLVRFEALARWTHPTLGSIPPAKFIPIAEESGLIIPLGTYILERACEEAVSWQRMSPTPVQVAVNVSSIQFTRESFVEEVTEVPAW